MKTRIAGGALALIFGLTVGTGCSRSDTGSAAVGVSVNALAAGDAQQVRITVSGPAISPDITYDLVRTGGQWSGVIGGIPVGPNRTFLAEAFDASGALIYTGSLGGVTIRRNATVAVILLLQQAQPPNPFLNTAPFIDSLLASDNAVDLSGPVSLVAAAHDIDGDPLTFAWTATGGTFSDPAAAAPTWTAPAAAGVYDLTLTVTDGRSGVATLSLSIDVAASNANGSAAVNVSFNTWPEVAQVTATPSRIAPGGTTSLAVTATDADGDVLTYAWSDGGGACSGTFGGAPGASPTWTAPATAPTMGRCDLTVTVTDGRGGTNTGTVGVWIGTAQVNFAPQVTSTFMSAVEVRPGETIVFRARGMDPEGQAVTYAWAAAAGTLTPPVSGPEGSEVIWTAPAICSPVTVTVTVTDPPGASSSHVFTVQVRMPLSEVDLPDPSFTDMNCDGIDGDVQRAYFVSAGGDDANAGTQAAPFRTVQRGIDAAAADPVRKQVLVAAGTYGESPVVADTVSVWGLYEAAGWTRSLANTTQISSPTTTGLTVAPGTGTRHVEALSITSTGASSPGGSSQAMVVMGAQGPTYVRFNRLVAGAGAAGTNGVGGSAGPSGSAGTVPWGGAGAGGGGNGGNEGPGAPGSGGQPGDPGCGGTPGGSSGGSGWGAWGGSGASGAWGAGGIPPSNQALGSLQGAAWTALPGPAGGSAACGGGGAGGTGNLCCTPFGCFGAQGGGGGGGGGAGTNGAGGTGGGGSFGVVVAGSPGAVITDNWISTADGGPGGNGGPGGSGGAGGGGAAGFFCWAGSGGTGGSGGSGGHGGGGAGGGGGMSAGILHAQSPGLVVSGNSYLLGLAGAGGSGGWPTGQTGVVGIRSETVALP